jgi:regulator of cell morphogenesis and NO signaling
MQITGDSKVAEIAVGNPATIKVFQRHGIDFCCGGQVPLAEACKHRGIDANEVLADLRSIQPSDEDRTDWRRRTLAELTAYIQERYHKPLSFELSRLAAMLDRVVDRHGNRMPDLLSLRRVFDEFRRELMDHMAREDAILFPLIVELEAKEPEIQRESTAWIRQIVARMTADHDAAGAALLAMRQMTGGYEAPSWACPTFLGLYHGLADLERDMQVHVHLENAILFPRAAEHSVSPMP